MLTMTMKRLQMNLNYLGYYNGAIDGIKGEQTKKAIRQFRNDYNLGDSDIADQKMIDVIRDIIVQDQLKYGATVDGVAGNETIQKKIEYENRNNWNSIKYFKPNEFECKDGCKLNNIDIRLVKILDQIREHFGNPLIITSGVRCAKHNKEVGGVENSRHKIGKAVDFYIQNVNKSDILKYCQELVNKGILRYTYTNDTNMKNAIHIDIL